MLLTKELLKEFKKAGRQDWGLEETMVLAKFFHPFSSWTWYATEYDPEDRIFYGLVDWIALERWSFSLVEFEQTKIHWLPFERDRHWTPIDAKTLTAKLEKARGYY